MTIPLTGPIDMVAIAGEFGGATPYAINNYYRGGAHVPNTSINVNIPTSGQVSFSQYRGGSRSIGVLINTGVTFSIQGITTDGGGNNAVLCFNNVTSRFTNNAGANWTLQTASSQAIADVAFRSGTLVIGADGTNSGANNFPLPNTSGFTTTPGFQVGSALPGTGPTGGVLAVGSNSSVSVLAAGNVYWQTSNGSTYTRIGVIGNPVKEAGLRWHPSPGIFTSWTGGGAAPYAYSTAGTAWTVGPTLLTGLAAQVLHLNWMAMKTAGGTITMVGVGQNTSSQPLIIYKTGTVATTMLAASAWNTATASGMVTAVNVVLWIPAANSGTGFFVVADTNGNFARSPDGVTWTPFGALPAGVGSQVVNCGCDLGAYSLWGTSTGNVIKIKATDIP